MIHAKIFALAILLCTALTAQAQRIKVEAVPGVPFGAGRVVIPIDSRISAETLDSHFISIKDTQGRVFYPAIRYTQPMGMVRELLGVVGTEAPSQLHVHFLFTGNQPLEVTVNTPSPIQLSVVPNGRPVAYKRLLRMWWVRYKAAVRKQRKEGDYLPIVETYLSAMLAGRMGLDDETMDRYDSGESMSMLLGLENLRMGMLQRSVMGRVPRNEPLEFALPESIDWPLENVPQVDLPADQIEQIAWRVPEECFYIRFAQFGNYQWLRRLLEEYGGDLSRMVMLRGTDSQLNSRVEDQLGLRETSLSAVLGPQVISDIAMIGRDTFLQEGAAIGILFEARNGLLKGELLNQRKAKAKELEADGAKIETIRIADTDVSFASTPNNRLRSFQVAAGKYHLVTNCREIATRFIECCKAADARDAGNARATGEADSPDDPVAGFEASQNASGRSLGESDEFRYARSLIPLGEDNTLFAYLSRRFFEGLISPQYQIELHRRLQSVTDVSLMELATLAAVAEGHGHQPITMEALVRNGFVGSRVDLRSDGSFTRVANGEVVDSVRGGIGTFLPIPDTPIGKITRSESQRFQRTALFHKNNWTEMDPVLIGVRRLALNDDTEHVEVQARMLPLNKDKYGMITKVFGPPSTTRIKSPEDDIVSVQGYVDGGNLSLTPHHLYFGIRDAAPKQDYSERRFLKSLQIMRSAPAYVAAWPKPGILDAFGFGGRPIGNGYSKMLLGLFRLDALNGFSLLSFDPGILAEVAPQLSVEEVEQPAQLHVHVGDIVNSNFGKWANDLDYQRAWETSVGNVHLMHVLAQQLRVPMSEAKDVAERVLDADLHCPLGGEYGLQGNADGTQRWVSSAWAQGKDKGRAEYVSPLMHWLRGLEASVTIEADRVVATGAIQIKREKQAAGGIKLPLFNFFGGGTKKPSEKSSDATKDKPAEPTTLNPEVTSPNAAESAPEELPPPEPRPVFNE